MSATAKIKNVSGEDLLVPWLGDRLVLDGQAIEVPVDQVYAFTQQDGTWEAYDNAAKKAHKAESESADEARAREQAELAARFDPDLLPDLDAGSASAESATASAEATDTTTED